MPARSRSRRVTRSRKSYRGGFAGLGGVIHQLSVPLTLLTANHHVGKKRHTKKRHSKKHHSKKHHSKKHHSKKRHRKMRGGTRRRAKGGMGFGVLDSREAKFIKLTRQAIVELKKLTTPPVNLKPFLDKLSEIDAPPIGRDFDGGLIPRNRNKYWNNRDSYNEMTKNIDELVDTINNSPDGIWDNTTTRVDTYKRVMAFTVSWPKQPSMRNYIYFGKHKKYM